jgi:DNA-binding XRE family transcriptional regulator
MAFAENVKRLRKKKELTQAELAKLVEVKQSTIAQYEKGMKVPTIITGVMLAEVLETTCEELVNTKEETDEHN